MHVAFLRPLYERSGPWASVYLDASRNTENAAGALELRSRAARTALEAAGCDAATAGALERALLGHPVQGGPYGLAGFANGGEALLVRDLPAPPRREIAAFGPLPHVMPLLAQLGESIPYVRVMVDRTGGRVEAVDADRLVRSEAVEGHEVFPLHRTKPGGWAQPRYQRAAKVTWQRNAGDVAAAVAEAARACGAEVVVVAGDPQARPLLVAQLPEHWQERVVQTDAGAGTTFDDATVRAIAARAAANAQAAVDRYRGSDAGGLPAVVRALQRGQVGTVLLVDDPSSTARLWVGPEPAQLSFDPAQLHAMGVADPQRARADAALVRAVVCSDADLVLAAPDEVRAEGGVAALLRYSAVTTG
ncbi:Vms1/Ankzf1 family peptidyl-tRNA hydrolase [Dactylosporangium sp. NPDC005572]|uniref:baeRF2 domain-containing protein n=1 Tax=Dactylosporangium sp. NPDC005572 TaxID=3156889 RepID=UPI0033A3878D